MKKWIAIVLTVAVMISGTLVGLALPVSADSTDTFKLGVEEIYVAPSPSSDVTAYHTIPVLTPDGKPYTEALTWTTSDKSVVAISTSTSVPNGTFYGVRDSSGSAVITATNSAGESHSCVVHVTFDGEVITAGDFESAGYTVSKWTKNIIKSGKGEVIQEDDGNHVLMMPAKVDPVMYASLPVVAGVTYQLSFDAKGTPASSQAVYVTNVSSGSGTKTLDLKADSWTHHTYTFKVKESGYNRSSTLAFGNKSAEGPIYFDNISLMALGTATSITLNAEAYHLGLGDTVSLSAVPTPADATMNRVVWTSSADGVATVDKSGKVTAIAPGTATIRATAGKLKATCQITVHEELLNATADLNLKNGTITTDAVIGELKAGDTVTVTATPKEGYVMVPGSLCYVKKDGTKTPILNKTLTNDVFGEGTGNTFQFVMPNEAVTITAQFESTDAQDFQMQTIGTSVHQSGVDAEGNPTYDGVRFLTRLNLSVNFNEITDSLMVKYNGKEYEVEELGSLLKREENQTTLTYENAVANVRTTGVDKMWISKAFTKEDGVFRLVDYTESYIDFASVMMTQYLERFYTARGYARLKDADGNVETILCDELSNSISTVVKILPDAETLPNVSAEKWSPYANSIAVEPNGKLTYTIKVTNNGTEEGPVTVFDPIPENTTYVEGADELVGKTAVWTLNLAAGETKEVTCTVRVKDDLELCEGGKVVATTAQVGDEAVYCDSILYIERIVNAADAYYVNNAILALEDSTFADLAYVHQVYNVSFSSCFTGYRNDEVYSGFTASQLLQSVIHGDGVTKYSYINTSGTKVTGSLNNLDHIAPTLYGGTEVSGAIEGLKGAPATAVTEDNLMIGDVIIVKKNGEVSLYIYSSKGLKRVKTTGGTEAADMALLNTLTQSEAYVVLRPRTGMNAISCDPEEVPARESYTPEQAALINTAEAYLMRGQKVQYADTKFGYTGTTSYNGVANEYRWRLREDAPEDCTVDYTKYINCSTFCYDTYYFGLGYRLFNKNESYTCAQMAANSAASKDNLREFYFTREITDEHTAEEKAQVEEQFMSVLQPGDLLIILRANESSNHVMMYIGNGKMIHATGSTYRFNTNGKGAFDQVEAGIRYHQVWDYFFRETSDNYTFGTRLTTLAVVRPLKAYKGEIPENTTNRMQNLKGIVAQKLSSHRAANTVSAGDTVTFTFDLRNTNDEAKTVTIADTVPAGTTYVSGADTVDGDALGWTVTIQANSTRRVSYTVRVNADTADGTELQTVATIGGVVFDCPAVTVGNTLTAEEQAAITEAFADIKAEGTTLTGLALANAIYERAGLGTAFADTDPSVVTLGEKGVFTAMPNTTNTNYLLATDTTYRQLLAPTMYGGNRLYTPLWDHDRTRMPSAKDLVVGDVIFYRVSSSKYIIYLYAGGDVLYDLTEAKNDTKTAEARMASLLGRYTYGTPSYYFAVLRPSLAN